MTSMEDDVLLKAVTGLEGGVVACGSTCGVVTGGGLGLALLLDGELKEKGPRAEAAVLSLAGEYARWFEGRYGTSLCRERTGIDFYTAAGQFRYFMPHRVARCLRHIRGSILHLHGASKIDIRRFPVTPGTRAAHCARDVLAMVRERTGTGYPLLERVSVVFDGGLGLQGGVCGALAGAVMAVNLVHGLEPRRMGFFRMAKAFTAGHRNLLRKSDGEAAEPFAMGKRIAGRFREAAGSLECRSITGRTFQDLRDFQEHMAASAKCRALVRLMAEEATGIVRSRPAT